MMKFATLSHERGPLRTISACVAVLCFTLAVIAQQPEQSQTTNLAAYKEGMEFVIVIAAAGTVVFNVIWSFFNRKNYDKLKETIADQKELLESRAERIENNRLTVEGILAKHQLESKEREADVARLRASNEAIVDQNLMMKAILKQLRNEGKWEGNEFIRLHDSNG